MFACNIELGKRYTVTSRKSYHYGQVVTAVDTPENLKEKAFYSHFIFVETGNKKLLRMAITDEKVALRPSTLEDEIRNLNDEELNKFLGYIHVGKGRYVALCLVKGPGFNPAFDSVWNEQEKLYWKISGNGNGVKCCPCCGAERPWEIPNSPDILEYWDSPYCRKCGRRIFDKDEDSSDA